jgi:DNA topoisomerase-3
VYLFAYLLFLLFQKNGNSVYNKIYEFQYTLWNRPVVMAMTSVSGHLLGYDFSGEFRKWTAVDPIELFDAPVTKKCPENFTDVKVQPDLLNI